MHRLQIEKPLLRKKWRRVLGREYYIVRRRITDYTSGIKWCKRGVENLNNYSLVKEHKSLILRPLKDVDMYLQENKRTNLRLAIERLNQMRIAPGQTFSVWHYVGRPTARKGYLPGLVLNQGKIDTGVGGGLCQLGNLLFWIFAHSPLSITERHRHSFDVFPDVGRNIPFGSGATLSYNYIDLRVQNDTQQTFYLELWLDETHLHGRLWAQGELLSSYRVEEEGHCIVQQPWGGFTRHNRLFRIITYPDGRESKELLVENHAIMMYNPLLYPPNGQ